MSPPPITLPRYVLPPILPNRALLGGRAQLDAFADEMLAREREYEEAMRDLPENKPTPEDINRMAAIESEIRSEGRIMRPFRQNFHD